MAKRLVDSHVCHLGLGRIDSHLAPLVGAAAGHPVASIDLGMADLQSHDLRCLG